MKHSWDEKVKFARELRENMTETETQAWEVLQKMPTIFVRQQLVLGWIVDFLAPEEMLAVEIDGRYHLQEEQSEKDRIRDAALIKRGYSVIHILTSSMEVENWHRALYLTVLRCLVFRDLSETQDPMLLFMCGDQGTLRTAQLYEGSLSFGKWKEDILKPN